VFGYRQISAIRRRAAPVEEHIREIVEALACRMKLWRTVHVLMSTHAEAPSVAGILRPVILLPVSSLTGLTPQQLESILAHELAHIRRYDPLLNALQILIETLLFYHPAIWWVSARIRYERELCCDDLALRSCGDALCYARALTALEKLRAAPVTLAIGSTDGPLLYRIRRIMGVKARDYSPSKASGILAVGLAIACLAIQAQSVGVRVDTAGATVIERIRYPRSAVEKAVQGTVVAQVDVDAQGNVTDAHVLSGPTELRKAVLQPVLSWKFKPDASPNTRQVSATFTVPSKEELEKEQQSEDEELIRNRATWQNIEASQAAVRAQLDALRQSTSSSAEDAQRQAQMYEAMASQLALLQSEARRLSEANAAQKTQAYWEASQLQRVQMDGLIRQTEEQLRELHRQAAMASRVLSQIDISGISDEQRDELMRRLPAKVGDTLSFETLQNIRRTIRNFQERVEHIGLELVPVDDNHVVLKISVPAFQQLASLDQQINQVEAQLDRMRRTYTESHPDLQDLKSRLEVLKNRRNELAK